MNLIEVRQQFRLMSGRYDLVSALGADTGANFYINEGSRYLDRQNETQKSWGICYRFCDIGHQGVQFQSCRAIKEVWASTILARRQLEKMNLQDLISIYMSELPSSRTTGIPLYYSPAITRYIPENAVLADLESWVGFVDVITGSQHEYNSILLSSPPSEKISIEIKGLFYSIALVGDTDENYWSAVHPMLLIMATMRQVEVANRNTQGVNDWDNAINKDITQIGMDLVEEISAEVSEMEG